MINGFLHHLTTYLRFIIMALVLISSSNSYGEGLVVGEDAS